MYFEYIKFKIGDIVAGKHGSTILIIEIVAIAIVFSRLSFLWDRYGFFSPRSLIPTIFWVMFFVSLYLIINKLYMSRRDTARKLLRIILAEYKEPFQYNWCCEVIVFNIVADYYIMILESDGPDIKKFLCSFLPEIYYGSWKSKSENAFIKLLYFLEYDKSKGSRSTRICILYLLKSISFYNQSEIKNIKKEQIDNFLYNWAKAVDEVFDLPEIPYIKETTIIPLFNNEFNSYFQDFVLCCETTFSPPNNHLIRAVVNYLVQPINN